MVGLVLPAFFTTQASEIPTKMFTAWFLLPVKWPLMSSSCTFCRNCVPHTHSSLQSLSSLAFDSSSFFLPSPLRTWQLGFYSQLPRFFYSIHHPSVVIHCYDLIAHLGVRDPIVYPVPVSSRAKKSTASP